MSIRIVQNCDGKGCSRTRALQVGYRDGDSIISGAARRGGWREVKNQIHLCDRCIDQAIRGDEPRPDSEDMRLPGESYCADCPDAEACHQGAACNHVRSMASQVALPPKTN